METKIIYWLEDDGLYQDYCQRLLASEFGKEVDVRWIATEKEFNDRFLEIADTKPACILIDIMLQWTETSLHDQSTGIGEYLTAGFRCLTRLANDAETKSIPIIFYTVLDPKDVLGAPLGVPWVRKDSSDKRLVDQIRDAIFSS